MEEIKFNSLNELYARLMPALTTKKDEFKAARANYISEADIWNYLKEYKWNNARNLTLHIMTSDILNVTKDELEVYLKTILEKLKRDINPDEKTDLI